VAFGYYGGYSEGPRPEAIGAALQVVPPGAVVATYFRFTTHLERGHVAYDLPNPWRAHYWGVNVPDGRPLPQADTVEYVVVPAHALNGELDKQVAEELRTEFEVIHDSGGVLVLRRSEASG
jgi:hypothetical protein